MEHLRGLLHAAALQAGVRREEAKRAAAEARYASSKRETDRLEARLKELQQSSVQIGFVPKSRWAGREPPHAAAADEQGTVYADTSAAPVPREASARRGGAGRFGLTWGDVEERQTEIGDLDHASAS